MKVFLNIFFKGLLIFVLSLLLSTGFSQSKLSSSTFGFWPKSHHFSDSVIWLPKPYPMPCLSKGLGLATFCRPPELFF